MPWGALPPVVVGVCLGGPPCPNMPPGTVPEVAEPGDAPMTSAQARWYAEDWGGGAVALLTPDG
ncbi:MAG: hypothetical protein GY772_24055 [bacterium]|nr:hypothetical protein [bacterium]